MTNKHKHYTRTLTKWLNIDE